MAGNINPNPFTTRPEIDGTFGVVTSTHWIATAVGMGTLERGGNAFDAAVATAFTLQVVEPHLNGPGGDVPVLLYDVRKGKPELICGQGPAPAGATIAHYKSEGLDMVPGTGLLAACVPGMFDTWMTTAARLRHDEARRRADARDFLCAERPSAGRARQRHHQDGREAVPRSLADLGGDLSEGRQARRDRQAVHQHGAGRDLHARAEGSRERRRRPRRADREGPQSLVAGLRRRSHRQVLPHPGGDGHQRLAAQGRADRRGHGEMAGAHRSAADLRLRPLHRVQAAVEPGPGDIAAARAAQGLQSRRPRRGRAGLHPPGGGVLEARLRRPREILRRSGFRRGAVPDACCRTPTTPSGASSSPTRRRWNCGPARSRASARSSR